MKNSLREAICFDDFWTAFGPRGFVAMAWWLGAQRAEQIRKDHGSYPLLQLSGGLDSGRGILTRYLMKLLGDEMYPPQKPDGHLAQLASHLNAPVLVYERRSGDKSLFDWRQFLPLYNDSVFALACGGQTTNVIWRGGMMVCAELDERCDTRLIHLELLGMDGLQRVRSGVDSLNRLTAAQAGYWREFTQSHSQYVFHMFNRAAPAYTAGLGEMHSGCITERSARNFGQLMAMVDCLGFLLNVPNSQRMLIQREVQDMAAVETYRLGLGQRMR
ncbi:hypothetical protein EGJ27_21500 [Pseudomonas sp. v388]|uniref:hypothetical protein n=1 Tax=Pseudomonas sp. v388 TaxID=2479849 RepID=UPI000F7B4148|nr:hypothetical protein [Pseudomonas sp. v388]RRV04418.1 hypothetical protein EGJ27_21500 [Pseudomonas sp. v388]